MKRTIALLLAILTLALTFAACSSEKTEAPKTETPDVTETPATETPDVTGTPDATETPVATGTPTTETPTVTDTPLPTETPSAGDEPLRYGMYYLNTADGHHLSTNAGGMFLTDKDVEKYNRFTIHSKPVTDEDGNVELYYAIYRDSDELNSIGYGSREGVYKLLNTKEHYKLSDKSLWKFEYDDEGYCRIINKDTMSSGARCLTLTSSGATLEPVDAKNDGQRFKIEKAAPSDEYAEFMSEKGNIVLRVPTAFITKKSIGATEELLQDYTEWFQEAYEAEIELTGYIPYDVIVINAWQPQDIVAGVVDNYNQITVNNGFMQGEITKMIYRRKRLNIMDVGFAMLHEMGHMFDSQRGWNFESEAWTDLKLCYVIWKMTESHKETDGLIFGCSSSDYNERVCHTYETMAEGLDIHADKGAMVTVYGFFGAARLFLLMAYDFGWDPFIRTFHWFQDNNIVQSTIPDRWEKFTTFVEKLSEFSGKDIRFDYLTDENWEIFRAYYNNETTDVV